MAGMFSTPNLIVMLYIFVLYYALIPKANGGPFLDLPSGQTQTVINMTHGLIFAVVLFLSMPYVAKMAGSS